MHKRQYDGAINQTYWQPAIQYGCENSCCFFFSYHTRNIGVPHNTCAPAVRVNWRFQNRHLKSQKQWKILRFFTWQKASFCIHFEWISLSSVCVFFFVCFLFWSFRILWEAHRPLCRFSCSLFAQCSLSIWCLWFLFVLCSGHLSHRKVNNKISLPMDTVNERM